jgi:hypothetical protein
MSKCLREGLPVHGRHYEALDRLPNRFQHITEVRCTETGQTWPNVAECAAEMCVAPSALKMHLNGRSKTCIGRHFTCTRTDPKRQVKIPDSRLFVKVRCIETGQIWNCMREAVMDVNISYAMMAEKSKKGAFEWNGKHYERMD